MVTKDSYYDFIWLFNFWYLCKKGPMFTRLHQGIVKDKIRNPCASSSLTSFAWPDLETPISRTLRGDLSHFANEWEIPQHFAMRQLYILYISETAEQNLWWYGNNEHHNWAGRVVWLHALAARARSSGPINSLSDRCRLRQEALSRALLDVGFVGEETINWN